MSASPACFSAEDLEEVPRCTWAEFTEHAGIEDPLKASEFLNLIAGQLRESRICALPAHVIALADLFQRNPYVVWIWKLCPEFRPEPSGMQQRGDLNDPDTFYLLNVMRTYCKPTSTMSMERLARDAMDDRQRYIQVQQQVLQHYGITAPHMDIPIP